MELVGVAVAVICLLSAGQSAPVSVCESLWQQLQIRGREKVKTAQWLMDCQDPVYVHNLAFSHVTSNHTLRNNTFHMVYPIQSTAVLLSTSCPDCLVSYGNFTLGESSYYSLQFFSRRDKVSIAEKEEFKQQAECLNLPPVTFLESKNGFCPDPTISQNSKSIDVTSSDFDQLDKILRSGSAVQILTEMASSLLSNEGQGAQS